MEGIEMYGYKVIDACVNACLHAVNCNAWTPVKWMNKPMHYKIHPCIFHVYILFHRMVTFMMIKSGLVARNSKIYICICRMPGAHISPHFHFLLPFAQPSGYQIGSLNDSNSTSMPKSYKQWSARASLLSDTPCLSMQYILEESVVILARVVNPISSIFDWQGLLSCLQKALHMFSNLLIEKTWRIHAKSELINLPIWYRVCASIVIISLTSVWCVLPQSTLKKANFGCRWYFTSLQRTDKSSISFKVKNVLRHRVGAHMRQHWIFIALHNTAICGPQSSKDCINCIKDMYYWMCKNYLKKR